MYVVWIYPPTFEPSTSGLTISSQRKPIKRVFKKKEERDAYLQAIEDLGSKIEVISYFDEFYNLHHSQDGKETNNRRP